MGTTCQRCGQRYISGHIRWNSRPWDVVHLNETSGLHGGPRRRDSAFSNSSAANTTRGPKNSLLANWIDSLGGCAPRSARHNFWRRDRLRVRFHLRSGIRDGKAIYTRQPEKRYQSYPLFDANITEKEIETYTTVGCTKLTCAKPLNTISGRDMVVHERRDSVPSGFVHIGAAQDDEVLSLKFALTQSNFSGLESELYAISTPGSERYRQFLSKEQVSVHFHSPTPDIEHELNMCMAL